MIEHESDPPPSFGEAAIAAGEEAVGVPPSSAPAELEAIEVKLLLDGIHRHYGLDFRDYALASIKRRMLRRMHAEGLATISALQDRVLHDRQAMERLFVDITVHATAMFRDPSFFLAFRQKIVPILRTYPFARIWHAGVSTGEELVSMAILLREEGLYERTRLYATDLNDVVLRRARQAIFPLESMQKYTQNYVAAGGKNAFSDYYNVAYDAARFDRSLLENVVFSQHNLVTDGSFAEFNVILCRNVMIYFQRLLQDHVVGLFQRSLVPFGILGLGKRESLRFSAHGKRFEELDGPEKLYRKVS